jgi:SSS family solute:Na+ symporter
MSALSLFTIILSYFALLLVISYFTGKKADNSSFFLGNRKSPWFVVAFGMIGASLSGVTFISVPGWVGASQFSYMQMVLGYLVGYYVIANVLLPLYYRLELTSIYTYLEGRFGKSSYKTGASFFLLSRVIGASFRLFLVANVLQITVFNAWKIPFEATVIVTIALIWLYTFKGGIKTIIWTDSLQTFSMLTALVITLILLGKNMHLDAGEMVQQVRESEYSRIFFFDDWHNKYHFAKQLLSGAFIAIVMTGLDQDMMQKNLTCRNLKDAKKNMYWMSILLVPVNLLFLFLGALLFIYAGQNGINLPERSDDLYPLIATSGKLGFTVAIFFIIGLVAAAYSSADSALTSLTTSFTVDILDVRKKPEQEIRKIRMRVHLGVSLVLAVVILLFKAINNDSVISAIFTVAGYTYGPLLGLFAFGLFTKIKVNDKLVPMIAILSPVLSFLVKILISRVLPDYQTGYELLLINGFFTFMGLWIISIKDKETDKN